MYFLSLPALPVHYLRKRTDLPKISLSFPYLGRYLSLTFIFIFISNLSFFFILIAPYKVSWVELSYLQAADHQHQQPAITISVINSIRNQHTLNSLTNRSQIQTTPLPHPFLPSFLSFLPFFPFFHPFIHSFPFKHFTPAKNGKKERERERELETKGEVPWGT